MTFSGRTAPATRADGVKSVLDGFIADRRDDRVCVIVFGDAPYVLVPFTRDTAAARSLHQHAGRRNHQWSRVSGAFVDIEAFA